MKGYKKLFVSSGKIPTWEEYENALECDADLNKKIIKIGELNKLAYEDLILSTNTCSSVENVAIEVESVLEYNQNNISDDSIVRDSESDDEAKGNFFDNDANDDVKATPTQLSMQTWYKPWKSCKLHTMMIPSKLSRKQLGKEV